MYVDEFDPGFDFIKIFSDITSPKRKNKFNFSKTETTFKDVKFFESKDKNYYYTGIKLPGYNKDDLKILIINNTLKIKFKNKPKKIKDITLNEKEISIDLSIIKNMNKIETYMEDGLLIIRCYVKDKMTEIPINSIN